jgi:hypothetical protein
MVGVSPVWGEAAVARLGERSFGNCALRLARGKLTMEVDGRDDEE